jgi:osmotically-inducible protein OsmY
MRASLIVIITLFISAGSSTAADNIVQEVRHELLLVPHYTVFDWLAWRVDGGKVTLVGAVVDASLKRDAENEVKKIQGVREVQNNIGVLPASAADDRIRRDILLSINKEMSVYLVQEVKQIHIIVKNGNVALEGEAPTQAEKDQAAALARHAQGVHDVANNLVVQK